MRGIFSWDNRRRIAIDLGGSAIKLLLAEETRRGIRVLRHQLIDLREEGLFAPEEISRQIETVIREMGSCPVALNLPQHRAISQIVDLPHSSGAEMRHLIEEQTRNLSGLSESSVVFNYSHLEPFGKYERPHWVTVARENDVQQQIARLTVPDSAVSEVTTTGNALIAAALVLRPELREVVLVDLGANSTTVAIIYNGQGVFASSFPIGSEAFTDSIAALEKCSFDQAETIKRSQNLFEGESHLPGFAATVESWFADVEKILREWGEANPEIATGRKLKILLSGAGSKQPGLIEHLASLAPGEVSGWPSENLNRRTALPMEPFAVVYGIALESFHKSPQAASLLPPNLRMARHRLQQLAVVNAACLLFVIALAAALAFGSWQKINLAEHKKELIEAAGDALQRAQAVSSTAKRLERDYARLRPVLERQQHTVNALQALRALQDSRSSHDLWFVLFADQQSYASGAAYVPPQPVRNGPEIAGPRPAAPAAREAFITELCIPAEGEQSLRTLSEVVAALRSEPLFRNVDSLPAAQRRALVDPAVTIPDRHFALIIEVAQSEFRPLGLVSPPEPPKAATNRFKPNGPRPPQARN